MSWVTKQNHLLFNSASAALAAQSSQTQHTDWVVEHQHNVWITYAIPAARLQAHLPHTLQVRTTAHAKQGSEHAWLTVFCSKQRIYHAALPQASLTRRQISYQVPVHTAPQTHPGLWRLHTQTDTQLNWLAHFTNTQHHQAASIGYNHTPPHSTQQHYGQLRYHAQQNDGQQTIVDVADHTELRQTPPGFSSLAQFYLLLFSGARFYQPQKRSALACFNCTYPKYPRLRTAHVQQLQFDYLTQHQLLSAAEIQLPHSIVLCTNFTMHQS